ncbi:MAG: DNA cytosine methyltransferase [Acidimicrobiales bacterium]|nr:DNA cytosine methyltransferase [Acidimicrobiales bacterium]MYI28057.1 DNA cytosine methyltransferase [Acidimicrobiales bacterium]
MKTPSFLAIDFYCGAGGTTRGLIDAGGYVICGIDNDESNRDTYIQNNANRTIDKRPPRFLNLDMLPQSEDYPHGQQSKARKQIEHILRPFRVRFPSVPVLFAICAPCQSFTRFSQPKLSEARSASRSRDLNLLGCTTSIIEDQQPDMIMSENVASIRTGRYRHVWDDYKSDLDRLGYVVGESQVCASDFGVPQYRKRSIMLAHRRGNGEAQDLDSAIPCRDPASMPVTVSNAIGHLPSIEAGMRHPSVANHECSGMTDINRRRLMSLPPGGSNSELGSTIFGKISLPCHERLAARGKQGFDDVYTRMHPHRPSPTLTTRFYSLSNGRYGHYDQLQVRALSLREGAALQSFKDDYVFHGSSISSIARMIGNAVPPRLAQYFATWLRTRWEAADLATDAIPVQSRAAKDEARLIGTRVGPP